MKIVTVNRYTDNPSTSSSTDLPFYSYFYPSNASCRSHSAKNETMVYQCPLLIARSPGEGWHGTRYTRGIYEDAVVGAASGFPFRPGGSGSTCIINRKQIVDKGRVLYGFPSLPLNRSAFIIFRRSSSTLSTTTPFIPRLYLICSFFPNILKSLTAMPN